MFEPGQWSVGCSQLEQLANCSRRSARWRQSSAGLLSSEPCWSKISFLSALASSLDKNITTGNATMQYSQPGQGCRRVIPHRSVQLLTARTSLRMLRCSRWEREWLSLRGRSEGRFDRVLLCRWSSDSQTDLRWRVPTATTVGSLRYLRWSLSNRCLLLTSVVVAECCVVMVVSFASCH